MKHSCLYQCASFFIVGLMLLMPASAQATHRYEYSLKNGQTQERGNRYADSINTAPISIPISRQGQVLASKSIIVQPPDLSTAFTIVKTDAGVSKRTTNSTTPQILTAGQPLSAGDRLYLAGGSRTIVALDKTFKNLLELRGPAEVEVISTNLNQWLLHSGKIVVILDNPDLKAIVEISTRHAFARAQEALFMVQAHADGARFANLSGSLFVQGRDYATGALLFEFGDLDPGQSIDFGDNRTQSEEITALAYADELLIRDSRQRGELARAPYELVFDRTEFIENTRLKAQADYQKLQNTLVSK
ncbi:MAG: hypothetical protein ACI9CF_001177 [Candidatus Omnitrophota bacterium]|jgi:hypothetical protein